MHFAFVAADPACGCASLRHGTKHLQVGRRLPLEYPAGCAAHFGTNGIEPDATGERSLVLLTEAGIGPARARLLAVEASLDTGGAASALPPSA